MKKVKITILKTMLDKELAAEYGIDGLTACPMMKAEDVFYADYAKPQGFCDEEWKAIYQYVFALAHGADKSLFYYGDWIKKPGVAIVRPCRRRRVARRSVALSREAVARGRATRRRPSVCGRSCAGRRKDGNGIHCRCDG